MNEQSCVQESKEFLMHLGLGWSNLWEMLQLDEAIISVSEQSYTWNDLYGKEPVLHVLQYLKNYVSAIEAGLEEKMNNILCQVDEYLVSELKRQSDREVLKKILEHDSPYGLYQMLVEEKGYRDYQKFIEISEQTYAVLKEEEMRASNARAFWGRREEKVVDLLESMDSYLQQRYEIARYQAIEKTYEMILDKVNRITYFDIVNE